MKNKLYTKVMVLGLLVVVLCNFTFNGYARSKKTLKPLPMRSKPVTSLPWEKNRDFLKAKKRNNTNVLIAAYKTVLLDPLPGEEYNVRLAARLLKGTVVRSGSVFSQNRRLAPYKASKGYKKGPIYVGGKVIKGTGGGVCKIATTLYNVAVLSNMPIVMRYYHSMPVSYVPYGQDATVSSSTGRDFRFRNNKPYPIMIWSQCIGNTLYIAFYGKQHAPKVKWYHKVLSVKKTRIIYRINYKLQPGRRKIIIHGMDGKVVRSWVKVYYPNGRVQTKQMGTSRYRPLPYLIQMGK